MAFIWKELCNWDWKEDSKIRSSCHSGGKGCTVAWNKCHSLSPHSSKASSDREKREQWLVLARYTPYINLSILVFVFLLQPEPFYFWEWQLCQVLVQPSSLLWHSDFPIILPARGKWGRECGAGVSPSMPDSFCYWLNSWMCIAPLGHASCQVTT